MIRKHLQLTSLLAVLAVCPAAHAADSPRTEARERFARGLELFNQGDGGGALAEFKEAYELAPHPLVLFNLGLVYVSLKRPVEAVSTFDQLLSAPGDLSHERLARAKLARQSQATRIGTLEVRCNADHASVEVDGFPRGNFKGAITLRVSSGPHLISVSAQGHLPERQEISVAGGSSERLDFTLEPSEVRPALLAIKTRLPGVEIRIDDEKVGLTPLASPVALAPGTHRVVLRRAGYTTTSREVNVAAGATGELNIEPTIDRPSLRSLGGSLTLDVSEPEAVVYINEESFGNQQQIQLPPGTHRLRIERAGFHSYQREFEIRSARTTDLSVPLDPTPNYRADYVSSASTQRTLGWVGVAGGALVAGGSVGFVLWNQGEISDAESEFDRVADSFDSGGTCDRNIGLDGDACREELRLALDDLDSERGRTKFGWIGLGVGVAMSAVGVYLLLSGDDPDRYEPDLEQDPYAELPLLPALWVDQSAGGFSLSARF